MMFKVGDKVQVIPEEQRFYGGMYNLTTFTATIMRVAEGCTYVTFNNPTVSAAVLSKDLELIKIKGQQLEFKFMEEVKNDTYR